MMQFKSLAVLAAAALTAVGLSRGAHAATVDISGIILWQNASGFEEGSFNFAEGISAKIGTVYSPTAAAPDAYTLLNPLTQASTTYSINSVEFTSANSFALTLSDSQILTVSSTSGNIGILSGNILTLGPSAGYSATAAITTPSTGTATFGSLVVAVSTVPLPAALPLLGAGLAALGVVGWRRRST